MKPCHQTTDLMAPKPVHHTAIRGHGLFGLTFLKQHNIVDSQWSIGDIIDEFHGMSNLLRKRLAFKKLENKDHRRKLHRTARTLRSQCRNGRIHLQNILQGNNMRAIHNYLLNYKDMQRLYQKLPVNQVSDNINQRTFVIRKERDRLVYRLDKLKQEYQLKLLERSKIENRIKYENAFVLEEEIKSREFLENVQKSKVRLRAIKAINSTYKKVIQTLQHDETFYEPILRGLSKDIDDQANFIKHILYLGSPAIVEFKKLSEEYRILQDKSRKNIQQKIQTVADLKTISPKQVPLKSKIGELVVNISKRYTRETKSMLNLKKQLEDIEHVIKQIKIATLCSKAREIFPRFQSQFNSNFKLIKQNVVGEIYHQFGTFKGKMANEKQNMLLHNYYDEEEKRLLRIKFLEEQIKAQDIMEESAMAFIKNRADIFVVLRYSLWNLSDILKNVGRPLKVQSVKYPNSYLKLPLLKFEMQTMRAYAPDAFEQDTKLLLKSVLGKLGMLVKSYKRLVDSENAEEPTKNIEQLWEEYYDRFLSAHVIEERLEEIEETSLTPEENLFEDGRELPNVPSRKQIKLQSAKLVEELSRMED